MANSPEGSRIVDGPPVLAIGWIPHLSYLDPLPPAFADHPSVKALKRMLGTGNVPSPPSSFGGINDFKQYVKKRNYRSIIGFYDVRLLCDMDGVAISIPHEFVSEVGYTPVEGRVETELASARIGIHDRGEGRLASSIAVAPGQDHIPLARCVSFRVGKIGNFLSKRWTGHYAPFARISCEYTLRYNGRCEVEFYGSRIPSQTFYVNWQAAGHYSMANISSEELEEFLTADTRGVYPGTSLLFSYSGAV
jgi:hypothetical protein